MEEGRSLTVPINSAQLLALAAAGVIIGQQLKRRVPILERLSIPTSIAGGLLFALCSLVFHSQGYDVKPDPVLRDVFQLFCYTIIGMNASFDVVKRGGVQTILLLALATGGAVLQNFLGMGLASVFHLNPLIGILSGSVSLAGGPATALAFGSTFEKAGVPAATTIALASATFGITVSGLIAAYAGVWLNSKANSEGASSTGLPARVAEEEPEAVSAKQPETSMATQIALVAIAMGLGSLVSAAIERTGIVMPGYIGAMAVAAIIRNINDRTNLIKISPTKLASAFEIALPLFIVMAMITLRLWELAALAGPLLIILTAQVALTLAMTLTIVYWAMGRDRDGAVISAGFCGFMLGVTANAMASMEELALRFGPAPRAFIIVPMVGAFLIDFTNSIVITAMANMIK